MLSQQNLLISPDLKTSFPITSLSMAANWVCPKMTTSELFTNYTSQTIADSLVNFSIGNRLVDRELLQAWGFLQGEDHRFAVLKSYLINQEAIPEGMYGFLLSEISQLNPKAQELLVRIAIQKDRAPDWIISLIENIDFSDEQKASFAELREQRKKVGELRDAILFHKSPAPQEQHASALNGVWETVRDSFTSAAAWMLYGSIHGIELRSDGNLINKYSSFGYKLEGMDPWYVETSAKVLKNSAEISHWVRAGCAARYGDVPPANFKYYTSASLVGEIEELPDLIFKVDFTNCDVDKHARLTRSNQIRDIVKENNFTHIRIPRALYFSRLNGSPVSDSCKWGCDLIIEEKLPIVGHKNYEVKEFLEELNQDPRTRDIINRCFEELTSLVCLTKVGDLKATNVALLKDGTGLGLVDSDFQSLTVEASLYKFPFQSEHSLIDWIAPVNFRAISKALQSDPNCPKDIDTTRHEKQRKISYLEEQRIRRIHLEQHGNVLDAPILLSEDELSSLSPEKRASSILFIKEINQLLKSEEGNLIFRAFKPTGQRRKIGYLEYGLKSLFDRINVESQEEFDEILDALISRGKILSKGYDGAALYIQC